MYLHSNHELDQGAAFPTSLSLTIRAVTSSLSPNFQFPFSCCISLCAYPSVSSTHVPIDSRLTGQLSLLPPTPTVKVSPVPLPGVFWHLKTDCSRDSRNDAHARQDDNGSQRNKARHAAIPQSLWRYVLSPLLFLLICTPNSSTNTTQNPPFPQPCSQPS